MWYSIEDLVKKISGKYKSKKFDKYISRINFPNFKNIAPYQNINFDFPLTAIVGPNGSGKSSILHAMWGAPYKYSTSKFWFSTEIDPIIEGGEHGNPRYVYDFYESALDETLSIRKMRTGSKMGYFEPTDPAVKDNMDRTLPPINERTAPYRTQARWDPVKRRVIYINSKSETSSFERFTYHEHHKATLSLRQEQFLKAAKRLKKALDSNTTKHKFPGGHQHFFTDFYLDDTQLAIVNYILGQNYVKARYFTHRFYSENITAGAIFYNAGRAYSETFAGSGELCAMTTILEVLKAEQYDLVLIDEPETSLHPEAQVNLMHFLLNEIYQKHLQVVITTHSPDIIKTLPNNSIKILDKKYDGKSFIIDSPDKSVAFNRIGHKIENRIPVVIEDNLLYKYIDYCCNLLDQGEKEKLSLKVYSLGVEGIIKHMASQWSMNNENVFIILDGDQETLTDEIKRISTSPKSEIKQELRSLTPALKPSGLDRGNEIENYYKYTKFIVEKVKAINAICPEYIYLKKLGVEDADISDKSNEELKGILRETLIDRKLIQSGSAEEINSTFYFFLNSNQGNDLIKNYVNHTLGILKDIISSA